MAGGMGTAKAAMLSRLRAFAARHSPSVARHEYLSVSGWIATGGAPCSRITNRCGVFVVDTTTAAADDVNASGGDIGGEGSGRPTFGSSAAPSSPPLPLAPADDAAMAPSEGHAAADGKFARSGHDPADCNEPEDGNLVTPDGRNEARRDGPVPVVAVAVVVVT